MLQATVIVCPVCGHAGELGNGPGGRPRAACKRCHSLERHRALMGILPGLRYAAAAGVLADIAPSKLTAVRLKELAADVGVPYVGLDFDPGADNRVVTVQASLTDVPLADASVGIMVCLHVLEHIPDDAAAMRGIFRVLAPGGMAVVQVPYRAGVPTDEDPDAPVEERVRRFGQEDHVRYYGFDFEDRLAAAGLTVLQIRMSDLYRPVETDALGLMVDEALWLCTTGAKVDVEDLARQCSDSARTSVALGLEKLVLDRKILRSKLKQARRERDRAVSNEAALRARFDVRVVSGLARRTRKIRDKA
ncbi:hypothetical protein BH09ACT10_BH09ACT10_19540 [soil metagenome]